MKPGNESAPTPGTPWFENQGWRRIIITTTNNIINNNNNNNNDYNNKNNNNYNNTNPPPPLVFKPRCARRWGELIYNTTWPY